MCYIMLGDEEIKLCYMLLANVLSMKSIVMANQCIDMKKKKDCNYNHFWVRGLFGN
jgi:hypothetical protein